MKIAHWIAPLVVMLAALGCSKTEVAESDPNTSANTQPTVARENPNAATTPAEDGDTFKPASPVLNTPAAKLPVTADSAPDVVVKEFLNALKAGNDGVTAGLLTKKAREETAKFQLAVQPPGTPSAIYEVTEGEVSAEDPTLAQVGCLWTEKDEAGADHSDEVVWVLHKESEGWRVCGMAAQMPTRKEPVFFDFEDPANMMQLSGELQAEAEAIAAKEIPSGEAGIREARNPGEDANTLRE